MLCPSNIPSAGSEMSPGLNGGLSPASPANKRTVMRTGQASRERIHTRRSRFSSYSECVNGGLEVVGDGVRLQKGVVGDDAELIVFATELLLQLQRLLEAGFSEWRLGAGVEQGGVGGVRGIQTSLLHLKAISTHTDCSVWFWMIKMNI